MADSGFQQTEGESKGISVSLHGPNASIESVIEVGQTMKELLDSVTEAMGHGDDVSWHIGSVQFKCDGCGLTRPDKPGPNEGWTYADGDDFCPACTEKRS